MNEKRLVKRDKCQMASRCANICSYVFLMISGSHMLTHFPRRLLAREQCGDNKRKGTVKPNENELHLKGAHLLKETSTAHAHWMLLFRVHFLISNDKVVVSHWRSNIDLYEAILNFQGC